MSTNNAIVTAVDYATPTLFYLSAILSDWSTVDDLQFRDNMTLELAQHPDDEKLQAALRIVRVQIDYINAINASVIKPTNAAAAWAIYRQWKAQGVEL